MTIDTFRDRRRLGARRLGIGLLALSCALAGLLVWMPPPSNVPLVLSGLMLLAASGCAILVHGLQRWSGALVSLLASGAIAVGAISARSANDAEAKVPMGIQASDSLCWVSVNGDLTTDLYRLLREALTEHPRTRAILLNSAGGSALSLGRVAALLQERGVNTAVMHDQCDSACAFLWTAAPHRIIAATRASTGVGFHAPHVVVPWVGPVRAIVQDQAQREQLKARGLPEPFIDWAYASVGDVWRPDARQLNLLGVETRLVKTAHPETLNFCEAVQVVSR